MLINHTHERLVALGLAGMAKAFDDQQRQPDVTALTFEQRLGLMIDREATERDNKRFEALALARGDGRYARLLKMLSRVDLLILDDWGLAPLTGDQRRDLLEVVDDRHQRGSTIITSQVPIEHWHEVIADPTIADAVLDRLVHNAHRLTLKGDSMRKIAAQRTNLDAVKKT